MSRNLQLNPQTVRGWPALAITISYSENHSILWAIIDGILSWLYVVYFALFRG
jgi:hypothetical protein